MMKSNFHEFYVFCGKYTTYIQETSAFISVSNSLNYIFQLRNYVVMYLTVAMYGKNLMSIDIYINKKSVKW